jgi:hypothetical protein
VALLVAAYVPYLAAYQSGCVTHRNGTTFLSANSHAVLFNLASLQANRNLPLQLSEFESRRMMACGRYEARFVAQQADQGLTVANALSTQQSAWQQMQLISKCLDGPSSFDLARLPVNATMPAAEFLRPLDALTTAKISQCAVGVDAAASGSSGSGSASPDASSNHDSSFNSGASFNCSWLPACPLNSCSGPSVSAIRSSSRTASCASEYALHHALLYGLLVLVVFLSLQLSRFACNRAVVRIGWRALTPQGITFLATCDHLGKQKVAQDDEEEEKERKRRRRKKRRRKLGLDDDDHSDSSGSSSDDEEDENDDSDLSASESENSQSRSSKALKSKNKKEGAGKAAEEDPLSVQRKLLRRSMLAYESTANTYLLITLLAHAPYLLLLLALRDPLGWGSSVRIAEPRN